MNAKEAIQVLTALVTGREGAERYKATTDAIRVLLFEVRRLSAPAPDAAARARAAAEALVAWDKQVMEGNRILLGTNHFLTAPHATEWLVKAILLSFAFQVEPKPAEPARPGRKYEPERPGPTYRPGQVMELGLGPGPVVRLRDASWCDASQEWFWVSECLNGDVLLLRHPESRLHPHTMTDADLAVEHRTIKFARGRRPEVATKRKVER